MTEEGHAITKEGAKDKIRKLANSFSNTPASDLTKKSEEQIKFQFIEPLLEALGWQKENIEKEQRVLKGRADYILKLGNQEVMVIEAKRTSVPLDEEEGRQAVSYAYHRKIRFAVLTNFKQIRVYHALSNIKNINKNLLTDGKGYLVLNSYDFVNEFDRLRILSRESFEKGEINKLLSAKDEKVSKPIDESILEDLLQFRDWLSKDLKKLRMHLSDGTIDEIVQILIDRLIFMRSVEDRGLEEKGLLLNMLKDTEQGRTEKVLWGILKDAFRAFDKTYNSKLFSEGLLEKEGFFDEDTLKKVINGLYFGTKDNRERYMFDEIPGDLLGNIYEQYLGTVLRGSDKRVKLEEGTGKRKKMGIYYTPSYIVDYIVKNTVGEYIRNKTIDEILDTRIVDPACGSGSFLIRAFREVCDVVEAKLKKSERSGNWKLFKDYKGRLNLGQKMQILTNCIYGVDLDEKAVELAQLNLLLRLLEDETRETRKQLPPLKDNIKCGNSLIDDLTVSDKAFNWRAQFPKVFAQGGFDVVVGNPPYIRNRELKENEKLFFEKRYQSAEGQYDIYQLFFEESINNIKQGAILGFITSNKYAITDYGKKLRKFILDNCSILKIVDVSNIAVFKEASTYPYILTLKKDSNEARNNTDIEVIKSDSEEELLKVKPLKIKQKIFLENDGFVFNVSSNKSESKLLGKIYMNAEKLGDIAIIKETVHTGNIREQLISNSKTNENCRKLLRGKDCQRYYFEWADLWLVADYTINKSKGEYATIPDKSYFEQPKIFLREIAEKITACYDDEKYYSLNKAYVINSKDKSYSLKYLLGLLNSKLLSWLFRIRFESAHVRGGHLQFKKQYTSQIPIHIAMQSEQQPFISLVDKMLSLQKKYRDGKAAGREKELLEQQIKQVDFEIDQEVYKIYGITAEEKKVIEESLR